MSDNDDEIEAANFLTSEEKQVSYYEQECYKRGKPKSLDVSELRKTFDAIFSNYVTCTEQMKLVVNPIALSVNEITQTDGQKCGIFHHVDRTEINKEYANEQIVNIITKHQNWFLPTNGAFRNKRSNLIRTSKMVTEGTETQLRK